MASNKRPSSRKSIGYLPSPDLDPAIGDKENIGAQDSQDQVAAGVANAKQRKTRSKSLGPGGLDALKEDSGNKRNIAGALPKSILKPSVPLSPLKEIPTRRAGSASKPASNPTSPRPKSPASPSKKTGSAETPQKIGSVSPSKKQTPQKQHEEHNTQAEHPAQGDGAREGQEQRDAAEKARAARRKSMANRRVSFAPEATLHTFDNLDDLQDSTTSSAGRSSRRGSVASPKSFSSSAESGEPPSTPDEQAEEDAVQASPGNQRGLHQKKRRRRSSGIPPMNFNNPDEASSSSPASEASNLGDESTVNAVEEDDNIPESPSESVSGRDATVSDLMDTDEPTGPQDARHGQDENMDLDQALQATAQQSDTHDDGLEDDKGNTMEIAGDDVTAAFQPWVQQLSRSSQSASRFIPTTDQENVNPFSPAFRANQSQISKASPARSIQDGGDMSMDITRPTGGIVRSPAKPSGSVKQSPARRASVANRRRSSGGSSAFDDGTMDFTAAVGGIQPSGGESQDSNGVDDNEDLSMEFTSVFGGTQNRRKSGMPNQAAHLSSLETVSERTEAEEVDDGGTMDMTTSFGNIMPRDDAGDQTGQMDMTRAIGGIIQPNQSSPARKSPARSHAMSATKSSAQKSITPQARPATSISATGSPALSAPRSRGRPRKSDASTAVATPPQGSKTPPKQMTPQPGRPDTPNKTPPANVALRHPSPKKLFQQEIKQAKASPAQQSSAFFQEDEKTGRLTPKVRLAPKLQSHRRTSGVGFDKDGLGSPQVAAMLDRRGSISDQADVFRPQEAESRGVRFQDPRAMEAEMAKEREEDERRESAQFILQNEVDDVNEEDKDATTTLKEGFTSMTPKKHVPVKGRKSLGVGSAKGVLGKRPAELDDEDEDGTLHGLRGRESPMKKIRLQAPPPASETTRRMSRQSLGPSTGNDRPQTPSGTSAVKKSASTPSHSGHFKDAENLASAQKPLPVLGQSGEQQEPKEIADEDEQKITLQDFLNMTNIRFMELNTTKRRHTIAPNASKGLNDQNDADKEDTAKQFEDAVVAGACTTPMLELYQHSCRELRKYISEGRKIVREIETNTTEENPALFREYMAATPIDRSVMDNQFKNMKSYARFLSKGMWYEWRMKLTEGLREVLVSHAEGLKNDSSSLAEQEAVLQDALPDLMKQHEQLQEECSELQHRAEELADCDQDELAQARQQLVAVDQEVRAKKERLAALKEQSSSLDKSIETAQDAKVENLQAIREAQRVREEFRGWSTSEVNKLKDQVNEVEAEHGWSITGASSTRLTMVYQSQLELFFDVSAFLSAVSPSNTTQPPQNRPISLTYTADRRDHKPQPLTTEKRFFLQVMRAHLHSITQHETTAQDLLHFISTIWTQCLAVSEEIHRLDLSHITVCDILSDERLAVRSMMLIPNAMTKVNVVFEIGAGVKEMGVEVKLKARAEVVYGEGYREDKMREFLRGRVGEGVGNGGQKGKGSWADAVRELRRRLVQRGRK